MKPFFSVIVPALNEEHYIGTLLNALVAQSYKDFEVIVVDAKSTDKTVRVANDFSKNLNLKTISTPHKNISLSRNLGAEKANGKYFVFIDADNSIYPNFLEEIKKLIDRKGYDMLIPAVTPDSKRLLHKVIFGFTGKMVILAKTVNIPFSTGGNLVIKREKFHMLKGFNKDLFVGEDHEIVKRAMQNKLKMYFTSKNKIIFSTRRLEKEKFSLVLKYFVSTIIIALFGKITHRIYSYQMGGHNFKKSVQKVNVK